VVLSGLQSTQGSRDQSETRSITMSYVEVRAHRRKARKTLDHVAVHANERGDGHVVVHHYDDGTEETHEFRHPEQNADALAHLAEHMRLRVPNDAEEGGQ